MELKSNKDVLLEMKDAYVNYDALQDVFGIFDIPSCNIVAEVVDYPRGNKLPKKKRIRNKWIKKYHTQHEFEDVEVEFELE